MMQEDTVKATFKMKQENLTRLQNFAGYTHDSVGECLDGLIEDHLSYVSTKIMNPDKLEEFADDFRQYAFDKLTELRNKQESEHEWKMHRALSALVEDAVNNEYKMHELYRVYKRA